MTPERKAAIEAMARAHDPVRWRWFDNRSEDKNPSTQEARRVFFADQISRGGRSLDAILSALPTLGLRIVPEDADITMKQKIQFADWHSESDLDWPDGLPHHGRRRAERAGEIER